ncbi:MAG: SPFH domain-containing protein, partial [Anaerolineales bacterium]
MDIASSIKAFALFIWIAFFGILIFSVTRAAKYNTPSRGLGLTLVILLIAAIVFSTLGAGIVFINPEERGVVISALSPKGYREQPLQPGVSWIVPFLEQVKRYPISRQTYTMSSTLREGQVLGDDSIRARTKDGQEVYIDSSVIFSIDP